MRECPRDTAERFSYHDIATVLARIAIDAHWYWPLGELLPHAPAHVVVAELPRLTAADHHAMTRAGLRTLADLTTCSPHTLLPQSCLERDTVFQLLAGVMQVSVTGTHEPIAEKPDVGEQRRAPSEFRPSGTPRAARRDERPWSTLAPWLELACGQDVELLNVLGPPRRWWMRECPRDTARRHCYLDIAAVLARIVIDSCGNRQLGELFPELPYGTKLNALAHLGRRGRAVLPRANLLTIDDLATRTPHSLHDVHGVGPDTMFRIVTAVARASVTGKRDPQVDGNVASLLAIDHADLTGRRADVARARPVLPTDLPGPTMLPRDMTVAEAIMAGRSGSPASARIRSRGEFRDPLDELNSFVLAHDARERAILACRTLAAVPLTLQAVGARIGVSGEFVRVLERNLRRELTEAIAAGTVLGDLVRSVRAEVQPLASADQLIERFPMLARDVHSLCQPLLSTLGRLDPAFEVRNGWVATPSIDAVAADTDRLLTALADHNGMVTVAAVATQLGSSVTSQTALRWLADRDYVLRDGHVLLRTATARDRIAVTLALTRTPLTAAELTAHPHVEANLRAVRRALGEDARFVRVGPKLWALSEWGLLPCASIRDAIGHEIDANAGAVPLATLVPTLVRRLRVVEHSVIATASQQPYAIRHGIVYRRSLTKP